MDPQVRARAVEILRQVLVRDGADEDKAQAAAEKLLELQQAMPHWPPLPGEDIPGTQGG